MLKEYTLKVTVRVGGGDDEDCEDILGEWAAQHLYGHPFEITHEEVVEPEVERD